MDIRSLAKILLIIMAIFTVNSMLLGADESVSKNKFVTEVKNAAKEVKTVTKEAKTATVTAETAAKDAERATEEAKGAVKDAEEAVKDAEKAAEEAKSAVKQAKVVNISLFTTTNVSKEKEEKPVDNVSIVKPEDFKVESLSDLVRRIEKWWSGIFEWINKQQINLLVLFAGVLLTFALVMLLGWLFSAIVIWHIRKNKKGVWVEQICTSLKRPLSFLIFIIGVFLSSLRLLNGLDEDFFATVLRVFFALMAFAITWGVYRLVGVLDHYLQELSCRSDNNLDDLLVELIRKTVRFVVIFIAILFIGQTILGLRITALVAGAGIAGLAIALAAKDTLANFFGSVMIMLDKPFTVGERIMIDSINGTVETIGFRSTRIRSLNGHMFSIPNSKAADSVVENIAKRPYIKYAFDITLVYNTTAEQMERAMEILHEILDDHEGFNEELPPRIYFNSFNDWALNISIILWFQSTDYFETQQWKNDINLEILRRFNAEGLDFAFPTSTNYLVGEDGHELKIATTEEVKK